MCKHSPILVLLFVLLIKAQTFTNVDICMHTNSLVVLKNAYDKIPITYCTKVKMTLVITIDNLNYPGEVAVAYASLAGYPDSSNYTWTTNAGKQPPHANMTIEGYTGQQVFVTVTTSGTDTATYSVTVTKMKTGAVVSKSFGPSPSLPPNPSIKAWKQKDDIRSLYVTFEPIVYGAVKTYDYQYYHLDVCKISLPRDTKITLQSIVAGTEPSYAFTQFIGNTTDVGPDANICEDTHRSTPSELSCSGRGQPWTFATIPSDLYLAIRGYGGMGLSNINNYLLLLSFYYENQ